MKKTLNPNAVVGHFQTDGACISCKEFGSGHINSTYQVKTEQGKVYILQCINKYVFTDPKAVMENVSAVTKYLSERVTDPTETLHFVIADTGDYFYVDEEGDFGAAMNSQTASALRRRRRIAIFTRVRSRSGVSKNYCAIFPRRRCMKPSRCSIIPLTATACLRKPSRRTLRGEPRACRRRSTLSWRVRRRREPSAACSKRTSCRCADAQ